MKLKIAFPFVVLVLIFSDCEGQKNHPEPTEEQTAINGVHGKVKSFTISTYILSNNDSAVVKKRRFQKKEAYLYDDNSVGRQNNEHFERGNLIRVIIYNKDGSIASKQFRKYDKKGNRIIFWTSSGASLESEDTLWISKNTYVYDSDSNIVESNDGSVKTISKYDKKGRNTELDSYDNKEKLISSRIFKYDEKGDCLSDCVTDNYQKVQISVCWTYKYDERGDQIERSYFPSPEKPERIFTRSFDKGHNLIEVQSTRGPEDHLKYGYDNKGNLTEEFNYDSKDHILESIRYQYINFDTHGNWLKKITFKNGSIKNIVEREITYYQ